MAFDDVKINTPTAIVIWLNSLISYIVAVIYHIILAINAYQNPNGNLHLISPAANMPVHSALNLYQDILGPSILYLAGVYAYRHRGILSRIYAGFLGLEVLIGGIIVPMLSAEMATKQPQAYHFFLYLALSQLLYAFFGKCKEVW